jgi:hypothetical protein
MCMSEHRVPVIPPVAAALAGSQEISSVSLPPPVVGAGAGRPAITEANGGRQGSTDRSAGHVCPRGSTSSTKSS